MKIKMNVPNGSKIQIKKLELTFTKFWGDGTSTFSDDSIPGPEIINIIEIVDNKVRKYIFLIGEYHNWEQDMVTYSYHIVSRKDDKWRTEFENSNFNDISEDA